MDWDRLEWNGMNRMNETAKMTWSGIELSECMKEDMKSY